jgi:hypothetical protein
MYDKTYIFRYSSRLCVIRFEKLDKRKKPGEGAELEELATAASTAMPYLLSVGQSLTRNTIGIETEALQDQLPTADIRVLEELAVPVAVARKVGSIVHI